MKQFFLTLACLIGLLTSGLAQTAPPPVNIAIVGLVHDHALGFIPRLANQSHVQLVGIVETNAALMTRYAKRFNLNTNLFAPDLETLLARTNVQGVAIFTSTFDHARVVETCARHGLDAMMEKPLAVNMTHARAIAAAAQQGNIQVFVNYETSWYPANHAAYNMVHDEHQIGALRRIVIHDGHRGPKEIGCSATFLAWLTDPVLNGGGALNDFGCYGANLATWLMDGQRPTAVFAMTQNIKPEVYPLVEDEATIVVTYPQAQAIIQASWNWPFDRKDLEIYGKTGYVLAPQADLLRVRTEKMPAETQVIPPALTGVNADPMAYLAAVVRKEIKPTGPASLAVNLIVVEILDAAHESARTGKRILL